MLNIDFKPVFTRTIFVAIPHGPATLEQQFTASYEALDTDEFAAFDLETPAGVKSFLERVVVDLGDIIDDAGNPVPYSQAVRHRLILQPWARQGLVEGYLRGFRKAAEGKLIWAARAWVAGEFASDDTQEDDDAIADARRWGATDEQLAEIRRRLNAAEPGTRLWAMHFDAFRALCAAGTQWRSRLVLTDRGPRELVVGLDYAGLKIALDGMQICMMPATWRQLLTMERAAAAAMNGE